MVFNSIKYVISFLTIIPVTKKEIPITSIAENMYLFPIVGLLLGTVLGSLGYTLLIFQEHIDVIYVGIILTAISIIITGLHHTDALADFSDGLMAKGTKDKKIKAMKDPAIGTAGVVSLIFFIIISILVINTYKEPEKIFYAFVISETIAKYCMVFETKIGRSAYDGTNSDFIIQMKQKRKFIISTILTIIIILIFSRLNFSGLGYLILPILISLLITYLANKTIGGITGDVLGASNEITRLMVLVSVEYMSFRLW